MSDTASGAADAAPPPPAAPGKCASRLPLVLGIMMANSAFLLAVWKLLTPTASSTLSTSAELRPVSRGEQNLEFLQATRQPPHAPVANEPQVEPRTASPGRPLDASLAQAMTAAPAAAPVTYRPPEDQKVWLQKVRGVYCAQQVPNRLPDKCSRGDLAFSNDYLRTRLQEFARDLLDFRDNLKPEFRKIHDGIPTSGNMNNAFALWFYLKHTKPTAVIESGVQFGQTTLFIRKMVGPGVPIISMEPKIWQPWAYETSGSTRYLIGGANDGGQGPGPYQPFQDFDKVRWDELLTAEQLRNVFVVLDDHQDVRSRVRTMQKYGMRWAYDDDNYRRNSGDMVGKNSFNSICTGDGYDVKPTQQNIRSYIEMPALHDPCRLRPSLSDPEELGSLKLPLEVRKYVPWYAPLVEVRLG